MGSALGKRQKRCLWEIQYWQTTRSGAKMGSMQAVRQLTACSVSLPPLSFHSLLLPSTLKCCVNQIDGKECCKLGT